MENCTTVTPVGNVTMYDSMACLDSLVCALLKAEEQKRKEKMVNILATSLITVTALLESLTALLEQFKLTRLAGFCSFQKLVNKISKCLEEKPSLWNEQICQCIYNVKVRPRSHVTTNTLYKRTAVANL